MKERSSVLSAQVLALAAFAGVAAWVLVPRGMMQEACAHTLTSSNQARVDQPPPALYRQDWVPMDEPVGPAEPLAGWRRVVWTGTSLAGPVNATVPRPGRLFCHPKFLTL